VSNLQNQCRCRCKSKISTPNQTAIIKRHPATHPLFTWRQHHGSRLYHYYSSSFVRHLLPAASFCSGPTPFTGHCVLDCRWFDYHDPRAHMLPHAPCTAVNRHYELWPSCEPALMPMRGLVSLCQIGFASYLSRSVLTPPLVRGTGQVAALWILWIARPRRASFTDAD
jgi:hypothetical protein